MIGSATITRDATDADGRRDTNRAGRPHHRCRLGALAHRGAAGFGIVSPERARRGWGGAVLFASLYLGATALWALVRKRSWLGPMRRRAVRDPARVRVRRPARRQRRGDARRARAEPRPTPARRAEPTDDAEAERGRANRRRSLPSFEEQAAALPAPEPAPVADVAAVEAVRRSRRPRWPPSPARGQGPRAEDRLRPGPVRAGWMDVDRNGCDTRNDILARDLTGETLQARHPQTAWCSPARWPTRTRAERSTSSAARTRRRPCRSTTSSHCRTRGRRAPRAWTRPGATAFANDPLNLLAVDGPPTCRRATATPRPGCRRTRRTAARTWPDRSAVKVTYGLWVTQAERDAIARVLDDVPERAAAGRVVACRRPAAGPGRRRLRRPGARSCPRAPAPAPRTAHRRPRRPPRASTTRTAPRPGPQAPHRSTSASPATHPTSTATSDGIGCEQRP